MKPFWKRELRLPSPEYWTALGLLTCVVLVMFREFVFLGRVFYERDVQMAWYTQVRAFLFAVTSGAWPVWDPRASFGQPLWAYPTQVPYPTTWLNLLFPPWHVYTLIVVLHLVFSGTGLYTLARRLGVSRPGALVGAAAWITCGPLLSVVNVINNIIGAAWIPWIVLAAQAALESGRVVHAALWGASLAAPVLAGSEAVFMGGLFTAADTLRRVRWRRPADPANGRLARSAALALLFALALSAAQWVPTLELTRRTARQALSRDIRTAWSLDLLSLAQVGIPLDLKDLPFRTQGHLGLFDVQTFLGSVYLGIPLLAVATAAFDSPHRSRAWFYGAAALVSVGFALGRHAPFYDPLVFLAPPLRVIRFPVKAMILAAFCACVLAAMGLDGWRELVPKRARWARWVVIPTAVVTILSLLAAAALRTAPEALGGRFLVGGAALASFEPLLGWRARRLMIGAVVGLLVVALAVWRTQRPRAARLSSVMVGLVVVLDLMGTHSSLNLAAPKELYLYWPPILGAVEPRQEARLFWDSSSSEAAWKHPPPGLPPALALAVTFRAYAMPPVAAAWGFFGSYENDEKQIQPPFLASLDDLLRANEGRAAFVRLLQLGAVTHVISLDTRGLDALSLVTMRPSPFSEPIYLFRVPDPLPRTFVVGRARVADGRAALETLLDPRFDPRREIVVASGAGGTSAGSAGHGRIAAFRADRVEIEAELNGAGYVVLVDTFDPWWRATVDGEDTPVLRANVAFRAVSVGAGRHRIVFTYRPPSVIAGLIVSAVGVVAGLGLAVRELAQG